ncbi:efflux RND transporter periplasmic adaptor subunit [Fulvivirga sp. RKSG066]|uniref:efflux RND transporter periplasmic adaptor subunit n=1 Tax=Fulvivirga aurantia TaxID=2529383 RepID=UPI0012BC442A|nr:efflux RND transporter periplasmic adaptor subunit [Fulvivirga aurantia]MTI21357.1 efflux RND transporter periplasmic adaptor subunit [Fulvivirga aurantia]
MKTSTKITIAIIVLICLGFIIIPRLNLGEEESAPTQDEPTESKLTVSAVVVKNRALDNDLKVTGSLVANESVTLRSEVSGIVDKILFKEGQKVRKGQVLVQLNDDELQAELEKLQFTQKLNEDIEYRQKQLLAKEAISKEEYETALTTLNTSRAEIKVKRVQIQQHKIKAPFDGIIGLRQISQGSYLNPSDQIATLYNISPIKVDFSIPGKYTSEVNEGDKISFTVDAYEERFNGEIYAIEPQIDPQTRSIKLRAVSDNLENKLLPGQFAKIALTISTFETALLVPTEAVIPELDGKKVFVIENGLVANRVVETGIRTADKVQVTTGLNDGDTVVTTGILQIRPGMEVGLNLGEVTYE